MEVLEPLVRHGAWPRRLCFQQYFVLWHRRFGVRRVARRDLRPVGIPYQCRLDRGRRRRIRLRPELERQDRISLRRSRERQLHHHRRVERLPVWIGARRRQLSLLIATRKRPTATSRPLCGRDFFKTSALDHDPIELKSDHDLISLLEHDLRANASRLSRGKTATYFSGSCSKTKLPG